MDKKCVPCEAIGRDEVLATDTILFNEELVPCCDYCKDLIENDLFFNNEEPDEQDYY